MQIKAKILPIASSNIDTDQIIPARYLTGISKEGLGQYLLEDVCVVLATGTEKVVSMYRIPTYVLISYLSNLVFWRIPRHQVCGRRQ